MELIKMNSSRTLVLKNISLAHQIGNFSFCVDNTKPVNNCISFEWNHQLKLVVHLIVVVCETDFCPRQFVKQKLQRASLKRRSEGKSSPALIKAVNSAFLLSLFFVKESVGWLKFNLCDNVKHGMTLIDAYSPGKLNDLIWTIKFSLRRWMLEREL